MKMGRCVRTFVSQIPSSLAAVSSSTSGSTRQLGHHQRTENHIAHMSNNRSFRRSLQDVRARRGADVGSDLLLLIGRLKLKLNKIPGDREQQEEVQHSSIKE